MGTQSRGWPGFGGWPVQAVARLRLVPDASRPDFEKQLTAIPAVQSAWHITGEADYELRLGCRDLADLRSALRDLRSCPGTTAVTAALVLGEVDGLPGPGCAAAAAAGTHRTETS